MNQPRLEIPTIAGDREHLPTYASEDAAGADIRAFLDEPVVIPSGGSAMIPTGLRFEIPPGFEIQVRPRSGLAFKHQVTVLNTPGTIDADYRGEVRVILINHGNEDFIIQHGMRVAQLVVAPVIQGSFVLSAELSVTKRGTGGFGHTGTH